ncbi:MAG: ADP-forming succinate--CoA ligase subunit beta [Deltaproteobacteria bacterium]|nr:ADP-forming succinate--CoA ligase subunit beta [Deltaproteobacteria bacterium]
MRLHEYQAKSLFRRFGIPVPAGDVAASIQDAAAVAEKLRGPPWVVKAQIHAGGRGKGGGIRLVHSLEELREASEAILNQPLITKQTGSKGKKVHRLLIEQGAEIQQELYLAMTIDRNRARPVMIFSQAGGMDIEEIAEESPELIFRESVHPELGWMPFQGRRLVYRMSPLPQPETLKELMDMMARLHKTFVTLDCSLAEINPLIITKNGAVMAIDAKMDIDDNALFRQKELLIYDDPTEKDPLEQQAEEYGLNYIRLEGSIGAMVNGAGLAMATMDVIKLAGAEPANFLDVGGGASQEMVAKGLEIILKDKRVKAILINIFGGILRCDVLARGVLNAAEKIDIRVPIIVRLEGTNVDQGRKILEESSLRFRVAGDMAEAAALVAEQVSG